MIGTVTSRVYLCLSQLKTFCIANSSQDEGTLKMLNPAVIVIMPTKKRVMARLLKLFVMSGTRLWKGPSISGNRHGLKYSSGNSMLELDWSSIGNTVSRE